MKIKALLTSFLFFSFIISEACSCFEGFKGYKGYPLTLGLSAKVFNQLALIEIKSVDSTGARAIVVRDYCNSIDVHSITIENMDPGWQCGYSTDEFKKGDKILAVLAGEGSKKHLSICYESFVNLSKEKITGLISASKDAKAREWTIAELESQLGIMIRD